jgi:type IV pilus assembly protein PilV
MKTKSFRNWQPQSGFTMIEVLVALLVLSVGMLGLAGLQAAGMRYNQDAYLRSQASLMAQDLIERMKLNRANAPSYVTADPTGGCATAGGTPANQMQADMVAWCGQVTTMLPAPTGAGTVPVTLARNTNEYSVVMRWYDRTSNSDQVQSWVTEILP